MTNKLFEFLNGKKTNLEGMDGTLVANSWVAIYPYEHEVNKLRFEPSKTAKESAEYQFIKQKLGDDWSIDLTDNLEMQVNLGCKFNYPFFAK